MAVISTGLGLTAVGVVIGSFAAAVAARMIRGLLFGVSPLDPLAFLIPAALLLLTGALAAALPAWRASAVSPAQALRGG
jgi:ABC-type antimicrobial peptide transport system permease subunit